MRDDGAGTSRSDPAGRQGVCDPRPEPQAAFDALVRLARTVLDPEQAVLLDTLVEDRERYRLFTHNVTDVIATYDAAGVFTDLSPSVVGLLGRTPQDLIGRKTFEIIHPDDHARVRAEFVSLVANRAASERIEYRALRADGQIVWAEAHPCPIFDAQGRLTGFQDVVRDVSARKAAELAARDATACAERALAVAGESEARYRLLADNANDMIAITSPTDSTIRFVSQASRRVLGYEPDELVGRTTLSLTHPGDVGRVLRFFAGLIAAGPSEQPSPYQFRGRHKDGRWVWLEGQPRVQFDDAGTPVLLQDVVRDITERKRLDDALQAARIAAEAAAQAKSDFLANMSHELRTPLTAVIGFANLIDEQPELSAQTQLYVKRVKTAGSALLATVNDVLDFSRLEAGQVEICLWPTSPAELAEEVLALFGAQAQAKGLRLRLNAVATLPERVELDPDRVRQVLTNLVGNAIKFTAMGEIAVMVSYDGGQLGFEVRDTGVGIPPDRLGVLFQRFSQVDASSTRRHGGTGLGLAICKGLAEAMGGAVAVTSTLGVGSNFAFNIPAPEVRETAPALPVLPKPIRLDGRRLLLAEDNVINRELVKALLAPYDLHIEAVEDGEQAISAADRAPFDLILMDLHMPGLGGCEAAHAIRGGRGRNAATPIVAFSADVLDPEVAMFDGLIAKPIFQRDLLETLDLHLNPPAATARTLVTESVR